MKNKRILTEKEIIEIIEKNLPRIIKKHPEVREKIEEIIERKTATKEDIKVVLLQIEKNREETEKRFEQVFARFAKQDEEIKKIWEELRKQREETDKRFEQVFARFAKQDEEIKKIWEELRKQREETNKRFEAIDRRFEAIDRRFEELIKEMRHGFEVLDKKIDSRISALGSRWGIYAEDAFRKGFEELLPELGYKVIKWRKIDRGCKVFLKPRPAEIDILIKDKKKIAIEIKSSLTMGELEVFERTVRFYEKEEKEKIDEKIIISLFLYPGVEKYARDLKIKVIKSEREAEKYLGQE